MALLAVASAKGSPGATTLALVVAALWPRPVLLADCDPAGGDVALRMPGPDGSPLGSERGLVSLAAVGRHGLHAGQIAAHTQTLLGGLDVLAGPSTPEQAQAMGGLWRDLGPCLDAAPGLDVIADCGRLGSGDAGRPGWASAGVVTDVLAAARLVVLVCRPDLASVVHLRERLSSLTGLLRPAAVDGVPIAVVVVARADDRRGVTGVREIVAREFPDVGLVGHLAHDEKGAAFFNGSTAHRVERTLLVRSGRELTATLAAQVAPFWTAGPALPSQPPPSQPPPSLPESSQPLPSLPEPKALTGGEDMWWAGRPQGASGRPGTGVGR